MKIAFVRTQGQPDRVYVTRSGDAGGCSWAFPSYGEGLPHDLVHLVVEPAFGLREGFWGRVDRGVDPARVNAEANRVGGRDKYRGFGSDRRELLQAEALAGLDWLAPDQDHAALVERVRDNCARMETPLPEGLTAARCDEVRAVLAALRARWRSLVPRGAIDLALDLSEPARAFATLKSAVSPSAPGPR